MLKLSASDSLQIIKRKKITKEGYTCDKKYKDRKETTRLKWKNWMHARQFCIALWIYLFENS